MEVETVADEMDAEAPKYSFDSLCAFPEDARAWDALLREAKPDTGPFAKFWALLLASDVADGARLCNFGACDALGRPACGPRLFLRECFARLWNAIRTVQRPFCRVAVAGGPGVGKTMFMAYCLLRLSKADPAPLIALDLGHGKAMRFIRGPDVRRVSDPDAIEELLECRSCVYLSDGVPPRDCCGRAIYFAADGRAAPAAFHGLLCRRLFLPPWTLDEMQICGILCHPDVPESEIRRCFALFGGRAGVVFPHARRAEALIETRRAIRSSDVEGVLEAAEEWCVGGGLGQGDRVLVSVPGPDFGSVSCGFHSQYVADEWVRAAARDRAAGLWGAVAGGRGEACGGVVESAWEAAAHNLLPGRRWVARGLASGGEVVLNMLGVSMEWTPGNCWPMVDVEERRYYRPDCKALFSVDALYVVPPQVHVFKMTAGREIDVNAAGIIKVVDHVKERLPHHLGWAVNLHFVAPEGCGLGAPQRYITRSGKNYDVKNTMLEKVNQYVLEVGQADFERHLSQGGSGEAGRHWALK